MVFLFLICFFIYDGYIFPYRLRYIYENGTPCPGRILKKRAVLKLAYVQVEFTSPITGEYINHEIRINRIRALKNLDIGDNITVLVSPKNNHHFTVYELGGYECVRGKYGN
jgi:hypothetical protein